MTENIGQETAYREGAGREAAGQPAAAHLAESAPEVWKGGRT